MQQAVHECQVSIYNQTPPERCVHVWVSLQVNVSVCIKDDQEVETIGHCCVPASLPFMQILLLTFLLSAPRPCAE